MLSKQIGMRKSTNSAQSNEETSKERRSKSLRRAVNEISAYRKSGRNERIVWGKWRTTGLDFDSNWKESTS